MRGMTDGLTAGKRVAFYRRRRGMSQEVLAGLVGRTVEWLRKVENDRAELDRLSVIVQLARTLDVPLGDLIGEPSLVEWSDETGRQTIPALQQVLMDYRAIAPMLGTDTADGQLPDVADLERQVFELWDRYQRSQYGLLMRYLPRLITEVFSASRCLKGTDRERAARACAFAHQIAALLLTKFGESSLAWISATRGLAAADVSGSQITQGSLMRAAAHALLSIGEHRQAGSLVTRGATFLYPGLSHPTPELLSVYGSLHLVGALAAARNDDRATTNTHLTEAKDAAARLGCDANHVWTAFGPTNVDIHRVAVAMEFGDVQVAVDLGTQVNTSAMPIERRVRHSIETARAFTRWNRPDEALGILLDAERLAPEQVRYHRLSRMMIRELLSKPRPPSLAIELGHRMKLRAEEAS
jgi:transcriptional regulator with XRE-family HTH domain